MERVNVKGPANSRFCWSDPSLFKQEHIHDVRSWHWLHSGNYALVFVFHA